jgi:hypothetical protein
MLEMFATTVQTELNATLHVCESGLQDIRISLGLVPKESPCIYGRTIDKPIHTCLSSLPATEMTHHDFQCEHSFYTIHTRRVESEIIIQHMLLLISLLFILMRTVK